MNNILVKYATDPYSLPGCLVEVNTHLGKQGVGTVKSVVTVSSGILVLVSFDLDTWWRLEDCYEVDRAFNKSCVL